MRYGLAARSAGGFTPPLRHRLLGPMAPPMAHRWASVLSGFGFIGFLGPYHRVQDDEKFSCHGDDGLFRGFALGFEPHLEKVKNWIKSIPNLQSVGRQGGFTYPNMHSAMRMGARAAETAMARLKNFKQTPAP